MTQCSLRGRIGNKRNLASASESKDNETDTKESDTAYEDNIKEKLLEASLPFVKNRGWTTSAIHDGTYLLCHLSHYLFLKYMEKS